MANPRRRLPLSLNVLFAVFAALGVVYALWWIFTGSLSLPSIPNPSDSQELEIIRIVFYAVAGIGGVVALTVAYRRQKDNEMAELREQSKHYAERFAAATEQLSSERTASRLSGVFALANLADSWDEGRQVCVDVLCGYLRMHYEALDYRRDHVPNAAWSDHVQVHEEQRVRRLIVDLIGERLRGKPSAGKTWHWCNFNFNSVVFDGGDFKGAMFLGERVSFEYAHFPNGVMEFEGAEFHQDAKFAGIQIENATINFRDVKFLGERTDFEYGSITDDGALVFNSSVFDSTVTSFDFFKFAAGEVSFFKSNFGGKTTQQALVSFLEAELSGANVWFFEPTFLNSMIDFREVADWSSPPSYGFLKKNETIPKEILLYPGDELRILTHPSVAEMDTGNLVSEEEGPTMGTNEVSDQP